MNGRKNGAWNKCTDPQCRECEESRVIYGVSLLRALIDVEHRTEGRLGDGGRSDAHTARSVSIPAANYRYREHS